MRKIKLKLTQARELAPYLVIPKFFGLKTDIKFRFFKEKNQATKHVKRTLEFGTKHYLTRRFSKSLQIAEQPRLASERN